MMDSETKINKAKEYVANLDKINSLDLSDTSELNEARGILSKSISQISVDFPYTKDRLLMYQLFYNLVEKEEFNYMRDFYKQYYENCFGTLESLHSYFKILAEYDDSVLIPVLNNVDDNILKNIYEYAKEENKKYLNNGDNFILKAYDKIEKKCAEKGLVSSSINIVKETYDEKSLEKQEKLGNVSKDYVNTVRQEATDQMIDKAASNIGISYDNLISLIGPEEAAKLDSITLSNEMIKGLASNSAVISRMPGNLLKKMLKNINERNTLRNVNVYIDEFTKRAIITKENTTFDKIATCAKEILQKINKNVTRKKKIAKKTEHKNKIINKVKAAIVNTYKIHKEYREVKKDSRNYRRQMKKEQINIEKIPKEYEDFYSSSETEAKAKEDNFITPPPDRTDWVTQADKILAEVKGFEKTDAESIIKNNTIDKNYSSDQELINNVTGIENMKNRSIDNWATQSAFATMSDREWEKYQRNVEQRINYDENQRNDVDQREKERIAREEALAEEIIKGRSR